MIRKVVRSLLAGAGAAGVLALLNRGLAGGLPHSHLEGTQRRWTWREREIFATEAGSGTPILLVHGIYAGASSYEYRKLFPLLARRHRTVAFDLLGCGLSDKPKLDYASELFVDQIVDAARELADEPTTLVASSLSGAFAIRAAARAPERFTHLVLICPVGVTTGSARAAATLLRTPVLGESLYNALTSKRSLRWFLEHDVYGDPHHVTDAVVEAYHAISHQPGAMWVPSAFVAGRLDCDIARDLPFVEAPILIVWGKRARINPARNAREYVELAKDAWVEYFVESALLPHEEEPEGVADAIERRLTGSAAQPAGPP